MVRSSCQLIKGSQDPSVDLVLGTNFVMATANVLNERVPCGDHSRTAELHEVDNLAELVDCPVQVDPSSSDFDVCFVDKPSVLDQSSIVTPASPPASFKAMSPRDEGKPRTV